MVKEGKRVFLKAVLVVLILILMNLGYFLYKGVDISRGMTGFSVTDTIYGNFSSLSPASKTILISGWVLVFFIFSFAVLRDFKSLKSKSQGIDMELRRNSNKNNTDIDTLYETLKEQKEIPISVISKAFNIDKDTVMEWCKILESGELVSIEYPAFTEPILKIKKEFNDSEIKMPKLPTQTNLALIKKEIKTPSNINTNEEIKELPQLEFESEPKESGRLDESEESEDKPITEENSLDKSYYKEDIIKPDIKPKESTEPQEFLSLPPEYNPVKKINLKDRIISAEKKSPSKNKSRTSSIEDEKRMIQERIARLNAFGKSK